MGEGESGGELDGEGVEGSKEEARGKREGGGEGEGWGGGGGGFFFFFKQKTAYEITT